MNNNIINDPLYYLENVNVADNTAPNNDYLENQLRVLNNNNNRLPSKKNKPARNIFNDIYKKDTVSLIANQTNPLDNNAMDNRYNPYHGFLHDRGLLNTDANIRYNINYLNIDSLYRNKISYIDKGQTYFLQKDPLTFIKNSDIMTIHHENHTFNVDDRITLFGLNRKEVILNINGNIIKDTFSSTTGYSSTTISGPIFELTNGSKYLKINYTHFLPVTATFNSNISQYESETFYDTFDISNLFVEIDGLQGNQIAIQNTPYFDNIPINRINNIHKILLTDPSTPGSIVMPNVFYIELSYNYTSPSGTFIIPNPTYNIKLIFYYIAGIPIPYINADLPINDKRYQGFHIITDITQNTYSIKLLKNSAGIIDPITNNTINVGGSLITVTYVNDIILGDKQPNSYVIKLNRSFSNIVSARLVSSEFPVSEKMIKSTGNANNKFYWQNLDDGDHLYSIELDDGNYRSTDLSTAIENTMYNVSRINFDIDNTQSTTGYKQESPSYSNHNVVRITFNTVTDLFTIKCYREVVLYKPFIDIIPNINIDSSLDPTSEVIYNITISHPRHFLNVGDKILLSNSVSHLGIPTDLLNNTHVITTVIDNNTYIIQLPRVNLSSNRTFTEGGVAVSIFTPNIFRLRFDFADSIGGILGFRNSGESTSITEYSSVINNSDTYINEQAIDDSGNTIILKNNAIDLSGHEYLLMWCKQFEIIENTSQVAPNAFAKIVLSGDPGTLTFNSFVQTNKIFYEPILNLSELDVEFYTPDGFLYDFNGMNHSYTIELITMEEMPEETNISANTGRQY
jgi:hypothetical protein